MRAPKVLRQTVIVIVRRRLLHHLLDVPAFHHVGLEAVFAALESRAAAEPFSPLVAEPLTQPAQFGARRVLKTASRSVTGTSPLSATLGPLRRSPSVLQAPGFARPLQQAGLNGLILHGRRRELVRLGTSAPDRGYAPWGIPPGVLLPDVSQVGDHSRVLTGRSYEPPLTKAVTAARTAKTPTRVLVLRRHRGPINRATGEAPVRDLAGLTGPVLSYGEEAGFDRAAVAGRGLPNPT